MKISYNYYIIKQKKFIANQKLKKSTRDKYPSFRIENPMLSTIVS